MKRFLEWYTQQRVADHRTVSLWIYEIDSEKQTR